MTPPQGRAGVLAWVQNEAGFAQLVTVNRSGFPVGRTLGAPANDDWSVDLVQRGAHRRLEQLRRDPHVEVIWVGTPVPGSRNDHPAVFDYGRLVPRVVFLRATAEIMPTDWTVARYGEQTTVLRERGVGAKAPARSPEQAAVDLVGVRLHPVRVRAEGFGEGAASLTWTMEETT
ncbi:MAG: pyridoxamine 5'-phosphate oxidase family protein [Mycobacteriaceae bacterium]